jgi:tetratricopeptide (TPR) repeat protein
MAEDRDGAEREAGGNPAAVAAALDAAHGSADVAGRAAIFLEKQSLLTDLQIEDLKREDRLRHWSLRVRHISDVMKLAFQFAVAFIVLAVAIFIGAAVWSAAHDNGLVVEAFAVPPDLAARGLTGQVVASQLLDKLAKMQKATASARPADSYSSNWGDDIKVQIPDTGVSIGEFYRYLRGWLGNETHISGEIYRIADGIAVTARKSGDDGETFSGKDADLDRLVQRAALSVYAHTQPYRYAAFVSTSVPGAGNKEAKRIYDMLVTDPSPRERVWAYVGLANLAMVNVEVEEADEDCRKALAIDPDMALAGVDLESGEILVGHTQAALDVARSLVRLFDEGRAKDLNSRAAAILDADEHANLAGYLGDFGEAMRWNAREATLPDYSNKADNARLSVAGDLAQLHDGRGARETWQHLAPTTVPQTIANRLGTRALIDFYLEHWSAAVASQGPFEKSAEATIGPAAHLIEESQERPGVAYAMARNGDLTGALALIAPTPVDCYGCLRMRGLIDMVRKNWGGAAYWFARAVREAPDTPFAYTEWGQMLLAKGDADKAIGKFKLANDKGPHFADPLEMWGEALMAKNCSDLALAKFEEANRHAPNWGRLHLKWGEALVYAGEGDEARKQFAIASGLDLSTDDRMMFSRWRAKK